VRHKKYFGRGGGGRKHSDFMANFQNFGKDNILSQNLSGKIKSPKKNFKLKSCKKLPQLHTI